MSRNSKEIKTTVDLPGSARTMYFWLGTLQALPAEGNTTPLLPLYPLILCAVPHVPVLNLLVSNHLFDQMLWVLNGSRCLVRGFSWL